MPMPHSSFKVSTIGAGTSIFCCRRFVALASCRDDHVHGVLAVDDFNIRVVEC